MVLSVVAGAMIVLAPSVNPATAAGAVSAKELREAGPGDILRVWPLEGGAPEGARGFRVLYRSVGLRGEAIAVTGAIIIPAVPPPPGGRPIVAWAHPTSGVVEACAPSLRADLAGTIPGLGEMLRRGWAITATDYPGLGARGLHGYLIGGSEARAVLDSVRAARRLPGVSASSRFIVWGHSQGGHAALFAGEMARTFAPELELLGIAAAAPATDLAALFQTDRNSSIGRILTAMAIQSWSRLFKLDASRLVEPDMRSHLSRVASDCIGSIGEYLKADQDGRALERGFLRQDPTRSPQWSTIIERNSVGLMHIPVPVLVAQGSADEVVAPQITQRAVQRLCRAGTQVVTYALADIGHSRAAQASSGATISWMDDLFRGKRRGIERGCHSS